MMIRKSILAVAAILAVVSLTACGETKQEETTVAETTTEAVTTTQQETTTEVVTTTEAETTTEEETAPEGVVAPTSRLETPIKVIVGGTDGDGLTLRTGPSAEYDGVALIMDDTEIEITAEEGNWGYTNYNDQYGWVNMEYVTEE